MFVGTKQGVFELFETFRVTLEYLDTFCEFLSLKVGTFKGK